MEFVLIAMEIVDFAVRYANRQEVIISAILVGIVLYFCRSLKNA